MKEGDYNTIGHVKERKKLLSNLTVNLIINHEQQEQFTELQRRFFCA
jgi:hypothetical protein